MIGFNFSPMNFMLFGSSINRRFVGIYFNLKIQIDFWAIPEQCTNVFKMLINPTVIYVRKGRFNIALKHK
jgi:hypothetical protein